uniref:Uncharacterized protein n=1 Tax=Panagrolaimus davidi TaxID=227884 RepID=A0A914PQ85_9BILA
MASLADILNVCNNFLTGKIIRIDSWKPWFFEHPDWNTILWLTSGFFVYYQSFLHLSIAINRAWTSYTFISKSGALGIWGTRVIWALPFISIGILSPRFVGHSYYVYTSEGELASGYKETSVALVSFLFELV